MVPPPVAPPVAPPDPEAPAEPAVPDSSDQPTRADELHIIGTPFRRVDGWAKVTGQTRFADDLTFPRMLHMRLVRSTVPHGVIRGIDTSRAGVKTRFLILNFMVRDVQYVWLVLQYLQKSLKEKTSMKSKNSKN